MWGYPDARVHVSEALDFEETSLIKLKVGKDENVKTFVVHRAILDKNTSYFARATGSPVWKESQDGIIEFPEDDPEIFKLYLHAQYCAEIPIERLDFDQESRIDDNGKEVIYVAGTKKLATEVWSRNITQDYNQLCKLYILAEKLLDISTKNLAIRAIVEVSNERPYDNFMTYPDPKAICMAFESTPENSSLQRLLAWFHVFDSDAKWWSGVSCDALPKEFLFMVARERGRAAEEQWLKIDDFLEDED